MLRQPPLFSTCELQGVIAHAIGEVFQHDSELFVDRANERAICHRLAVWIERLLVLNPRMQECVVDVDYSRMGGPARAKRVHLRGFDKAPSRVLPDIILHRRGGNDLNLLVIEVKLTWDRRGSAGDERDRCKLRALREQLDYQHGLFLKFGTRGERPRVHLFEWNGEPIQCDAACLEALASQWAV